MGVSAVTALRALWASAARERRGSRTGMPCAMAGPCPLQARHLEQRDSEMTFFSKVDTGRQSVFKAVAILLLTGACEAQPALAQDDDFGQTPYVPTPQNVVDRMLEVAKVSSKDFLIDLGSGDGRMIITAAQKYGARGF